MKANYFFIYKWDEKYNETNMLCIPQIWSVSNLRNVDVKWLICLRFMIYESKSLLTYDSYFYLIAWLSILFWNTHTHTHTHKLKHIGTPYNSISFTPHTHTLTLPHPFEHIEIPPPPGPPPTWKPDKSVCSFKWGRGRRKLLEKDCQETQWRPERDNPIKHI